MNQKTTNNGTMNATPLTTAAFPGPRVRFAAGSIDLSDRLGGYLVLAGMVAWTLSRMIPDEFLWNMQAARSFTNWV